MISNKNGMKPEVFIESVQWEVKKSWNIKTRISIIHAWLEKIGWRRLCPQLQRLARNQKVVKSTLALQTMSSSDRGSVSSPCTDPIASEIEMFYLNFCCFLIFLYPNSKLSCSIRLLWSQFTPVVFPYSGQVLSPIMFTGAECTL